MGYWNIQNLYRTYCNLDEKRLYYVKLVYHRMFDKTLKISKHSQESKETEEVEPVDWEKKYYDLLEKYEELLEERNQN